MKRNPLLGILGILVIMNICSSSVFAYLPPARDTTILSAPDTTGFIEIGTEPIGDSQAIAKAGHKVVFSMYIDWQSLHDNYGFTIDTVRMKTYNIDTYMVANSSFTPSLKVSYDSTEAFSTKPFVAGIHIFKRDSNNNLIQGWDYMYINYKTFDHLSTYRTTNSYKLFPMKLVDWVLKTSTGQTMDSDDQIDPDNAPTTPLMGRNLGPIPYTRSGIFWAGNRNEFVGTISPSIATTLGVFGISQQVKTYQYHNDTLNFNQLPSNSTTWRPDDTATWTNPKNSKIFLYDVPSLPLPSSPPDGDKWERKSDFMTFATQQDDLASETTNWHCYITATWSVASAKWNASFNCGK